MDWGVLYKDVLQLTDIASHLKHHMQLNPFNDKYIAACPFHKGKSESMIVDNRKGTYDCLDCGANGDIITFYKDNNRLSLQESLMKIASIEGINITFDRRAGNKLNFKNSENLAAAVQYFKGNIDAVRDLLRSKGYIDEAIDAFNIGYAPGNDSLMGFTKRNGTFEQMKSLGLIVNDKSQATFMGSAYKDLFSNRIIFPIYTNAERLIGFAGMNVNDDTDIEYFLDYGNKTFAKKRLIYGLNRIDGRESYVISDSIYETDLMQQEGLYAINPLVLSPESVALLSNMTGDVIFHADSKDLLSKIKIFESAGVKTHIKEKTNGTIRSLDYIIRHMAKITGDEMDDVVADNSGMDDSARKYSNHEDVINMIIKVRDPILRHHYLKALSSKLDISMGPMIESHGITLYDKIMAHESVFTDNKKKTYHHAAAFLAHVIRALSIKPDLASSYMTDLPIDMIPDDGSIFPKHLFELYRVIRDKFHVKDSGFDLLYKEREDVMDFIEQERKEAKERLIKEFEDKGIKPPIEVFDLLENNRLFEKKYRSKAYSELKREISEKHELPYEIMMKLQKPSVDSIDTHITYLRNKIFLQRQHALLSDPMISDASLIRELERLQRSI